MVSFLIAARAADVPCKLNNVTNEKHQKEGCLKSFVKGAWKDNVNFFEAEESFNKFGECGESRIDTIY